MPILHSNVCANLAHAGSAQPTVIQRRILPTQSGPGAAARSREAGRHGGLAAGLEARTLRRLRRQVPTSSDGLRPPGPGDEVVQSDDRPGDAHVDGARHGGGPKVRCRLRELPSATNPGARAISRSTRGLNSTAPGRQGGDVEGPSLPTSSASHDSMRGLWENISSLRHGLRPPRSQAEAVHRDTHGGSHKHRGDLGRGGEVRYRVRQLPPSQDVAER